MHGAEEEGPVLKRIRPVEHVPQLFILHLSKPVTGPQPKNQGWDVKFKHGRKRNQKYLVDSTNNSHTHCPPEESQSRYHPQRGTQQMKSNSYVSPESPIHQGLFYQLHFKAGETGSKKLTYSPRVTYQQFQGWDLNPCFLTLDPIQGCFFEASRRADGGRCQIRVARISIGKRKGKKKDQEANIF